MTGPERRSSPRPPRFTPTELELADGEAAVAASEAARALERAAADGLRGSPLAADALLERIMASVESEPLPAPGVAAGRAIRTGRVGLLATAFVDALRVLGSGGRPLAVRLPGLALAGVLTAVVAVATVSVGPSLHGSLPAAADRPAATASLPTPSPTDPSALPPSAPPSAAAQPSTAPPSSPAKSVRPASGSTAGARPTPPPTPRPTDRPHPTATPEGDARASGSATPEPTSTPEWTASPEPTSHE